MTADEVIDVLNKKSGMLGISGISSDLRDLEKAAAEGNERAELALEVFANRIHKYIGSYAARMCGVDAIIFTAGIGENSEVVRAKVLRGLEFIGGVLGSGAQQSARQGSVHQLSALAGQSARHPDQ